MTASFCTWGQPLHDEAECALCEGRLFARLQNKGAQAYYLGGYVSPGEIPSDEVPVGH